MDTTISRIIANHPKEIKNVPFRHVIVDNFFREDFYKALCVEFKKKLGEGLSEVLKTKMFSRFPGYDAYNWTIDPKSGFPLNFFYSREWEEYFAGLFGVETSKDVTAGFHHHKIGSGDGFIHNDYNLCSFVKDRLENGINPWYHQCVYTDDSYYKQPHTLKRVRAIALIYYFCNESWQESDGGETALYYTKNNSDIAAKITPINNRLLAFEITSHSFHGFLKNMQNSRNVLVQWFHQEPTLASRRCGGAEFVPWTEEKKPFVDKLYKFAYSIEAYGINR